jgi:YbbR domain-containing protein
MDRIGATLVRNWELKVASILIACAVWVAVAATEQSQVAVTAAVEYVGLGRDTMLVDSRRDRVEVEVQAVRSAAARLHGDDVRVRVDLGGVPPGTSRVVLGLEQVETPPGVHATRITPTQLQVTLARAVTARLPVDARVQGQPAPGYRVARVTVDPETVLVRGAQSTIETRPPIATEAIDVSGSQSDVITDVGLVLSDSMALVRDRAVRVTVEIRKRGSAR